MTHSDLPEASANAERGVYSLDPETLYVDPTEATEIGKRFAAEYQGGEPFHYIGIDNFLPNEIAQKVREEARRVDAQAPQNSSAQEHLKTSYNPDKLPAYTRSVFNALNSQSFLRFLQEMTGIDGLIPDPYYIGGGIHRTSNGGYLGVHADFNFHPRMKLERRLNVLIYLNPNWEPEFGGAFEIWNEDMSAQVASYPPIMNRFCCFSTSSTSMHGNPEPVNHPEGEPRLSIALYYYTATWSEGKVAHSTLFRPRPGSDDKRTGRQDRLRIMRKYTPPVLQPFAQRVMNKLRLY